MRARWMSGLALSLLAAASLWSQPVVAPTPERVGSTRGRNIDGYNLTQSFELGQRYSTAGGNLQKYRSDVNYSNGLRLLGSNLAVYSREGRGRLFDEIVLVTQGLGNDPYQSSILRVGKNRLYRYDLVWRLNEYVNPGLTSVNGLDLFGPHPANTSRRMHDHDLTLLPQSKIKFMLGYSRNVQDGPALSTVQVFDARGDEFPFLAGVRRVRNEYRAGGEIELGGTKLIWQRAWENFKEDTSYSLGAPGAGQNTTDQTTLRSFRRVEPYHGNTPHWRLHLIRENKDWLSMSARVVYAAGRRSFVFDESALGTNRFGADALRQIILFGSAARPVAAANLTFTLFPKSALSVTNHTGYHHTRMEGDGNYREFSLFGGTTPFVHFQFLGVRAVSTQTEALWRVNKRASLVAGYSFSTRRIRSVEGDDLTFLTRPKPDEQNNRVHAGLFGVRLRPVKPLSITLDGEIGRTDRPFYATSERNYHGLGARIQFKRRSLLLSAAARSNYNFNSVSLATHSSRSRNYAFDAGWTPLGWFSVDAGYSKNHLDTLSALAYFASARLVDRDRAFYVSNLHSINAGVRIAVRARVDLYAGFHRVQDRGDGRALAAPIAVPPVAIMGVPSFAAAQTFPLAYQSPLGRVSVKLHEKVRLNFGYQHYGCDERFSGRQSYRAHTGYSSVLWSF